MLPIHSALSNQNYQLARQYIESGERVNLQDRFGYTPLILCSMIENETWAHGVATLLLEHGAQISIADLQSYNAFHHACLGQRWTLVSLFLNSMDFNLESKSNEGYTALHIAALVGNKAILMIVAEKMLHYKLSLDPVTNTGFTPMQLAWRSNSLECGDILVSLGANPNTLNPGSRCQTASNVRSSAEARLNKIRLLSSDRHAQKPVKNMASDTQLKVLRPNILSAKPPSTLQRTKTEVNMFRAANMFRTANREHTGTVLTQTSPLNTKSTHCRWQEELYMLWGHYEQQCTPSFRKTAKVQSRPSQSENDDVFEGECSMPLARRSSRFNGKSRTGSLTSGETSRRTSTASQGRRSGPSSTTKSQSRASFSQALPK